ncbi:MAG: TIGR04086 family membrane protein [Bacteroidota bacterium]
MPERETGERKPLLGPVFYGLVAAILTVVVASVVATILLFLGVDWARHLQTVALTVAFAGVALGSVCAGVRAGNRGWLVGLLTGGFFVLCALAVTILAGWREISAPVTLARTAAVCLTGVAGGILGVNFAARAD